MKERSLVQNLKNYKSLPLNWVVNHFDDVLTDCSGGNEKILNSEFLISGDYPIVDQGQELIAGYTNRVKYLVKKNPPYIVFGDHTRIFKYINFPFAMGADGVKVLKPLDESTHLPKYLYYFFLTLNIPNTGYNRHYKYLKDIQVPFPSLTTQQKIAAILDAADAYRQKTKALIEKYDQLAQSLFLEMFGDPVKNNKGWVIKKLKDVCLSITDGTHFSPEPQNEGYPYVTAKHVKESGLEFYSKPTYVSEEAHNEIFKRCKPEFGDVLYIKDGATTGIACINTFNQPISLLSSLALLKTDKKTLNNLFLCNWLNNKGVKEKLLNEYMAGAAIKRFTLDKINSFMISVPPITLQNQFAERIQLIEAQKQKARAALAKADELFNSLLQRAFKGELVE